DGIRDYKVTGVQTCALPIYKALRQGVLCIGVGIVGAALAAAPGWGAPRDQVNLFLSLNARGSAEVALQLDFPPPRALPLARSVRSEERRVGKGWRSRGGRQQ